jgi:hypothetical protein
MIIDELNAAQRAAVAHRADVIARVDRIATAVQGRVSDAELASARQQLWEACVELDIIRRVLADLAVYVSGASALCSPRVH